MLAGRGLPGWEHLESGQETPALNHSPAHKDAAAAVLPHSVRTDSRVRGAGEPTENSEQHLFPSTPTRSSAGPRPPLWGSSEPPAVQTAAVLGTHLRDLHFCPHADLHLTFVPRNRNAACLPPGVCKPGPPPQPSPSKRAAPSQEAWPRTAWMQTGPPCTPRLCVQTRSPAPDSAHRQHMHGSRTHREACLPNPAAGEVTASTREWTSYGRTFPHVRAQSPGEWRGCVFHGGCHG